jgi:hypothetical protein
MSHLLTPGLPPILHRSGKLVPFLSLNIGVLFWAHGTVWAKTAYDAATDVTHNLGTCRFTINATDELVEDIELFTAI